jgi:CelD/BcsL family acetyltransferase involved in cellulose biosynthesis
VRATIVELDELSREDFSAWRALVEQAAEPNPFAEPDFVMAAADAIGGRGLAVAVVRGTDGWSACMPVHRPRRWRRIPLPCLATWEHRYCFLGTPLVRSDRLEAALGLLARDLTRRRGISFVGLDVLADEGPVRAGLRAAFDHTGAEEALISRHRRASLFAGGAERAGVKGRHRRDLERKRRRLEDELGAPLELADWAADPAAVEKFLELEASGWKGRGGTALASLDRDAAFFRTICDSFRDLGRLHLLRLSAGDEVIAMACNLRAGDGLFCFKIAYDEVHRRYSPGAQLVLEHIRWFESMPEIAWMDSCVGADNDLVNRLWPDSREIVTVAITGDSPGGRLARAAIAGALRLRELQRSSRATA